MVWLPRNHTTVTLMQDLLFLIAAGTAAAALGTFLGLLVALIISWGDL